MLVVENYMVDGHDVTRAVKVAVSSQRSLDASQSHVFW